jgi:hypothetical protein
MTVQERDKSKMFEERIRKEVSFVNSESNEAFHPFLCFGQDFIRVFEEFLYFQPSLLRYLDSILSNDCYLPLFNGISISKLDLQQAWTIQNEDSVYFGRMKNSKFCDFFDRMNSAFSLFTILFSSDSDCLIDSEGVEGHGSIFILSENKGEECEFSRECDKEVEVLCEVLKLSGGSRGEDDSSFLQKKSNHFLEIDDSVEIIQLNDFINNDSFTGVIFSSNSQLREIGGFQQCTSLYRIEIPSSVKIIWEFGFFRCTSLNEVIFSSESQLQEIRGFQQCTSLHRIEIPSSVEVIDNNGFCGCTSLNEVIYSFNSQLREIHGFQKIT